MNFLRKLDGRINLFFGFCPECNSSAPELYDCPICHGYHSARGDAFPPSKETKANWWRRFMMARCVHGRPMDDRCQACYDEAPHRSATFGNPRRG